MSNVESGTRTLRGTVTGDKRQATCTVIVKRSYRHPVYDKVMQGETKYHVHDPLNESKVGDVVEIMQVRPISKTKSWQLVKIVQKAE